MVKYELKKLFSNKFVAVSFILIALIVAGTAIYSFSLYKNNSCSTPYILLKKGVLPDTTVTTDNVKDLMARYDEIIQNDDNYAVFDDTSNRRHNMSLHGKYSKRIFELTDKTSLTPEEEEELNFLYTYEINDEMYPEFSALEYMLSDFTSKHQNFNPELYKGTIWDNSDFPMGSDESGLIYTEGYDVRDAYQVENGITYGRNFGWRELMDTGSFAVALILAVAAAIGAVIIFTGEYTDKTDMLIMSCSKGRRKIVKAKLLAGWLFSVIITVYYFAVTLLMFGCLFSLDGINTSSQTFIGGRILTYGEAFLLMFFCTIACISAIMITALAVASFCTKTMPSILLIFIITLLPFIIDFAVYISNDTVRNILYLLPPNAILLDFGYSHFWLIGKNTIIESHVYIIPVALIQTLIFAPLINNGWKKHKILN